MDTIPANGIRMFVDGKGKLLSSFSGLSDDQARICLAQIIDGLERMDELVGGLEGLSTDWRHNSKSADKDFDRFAKNILKTTSPVPPAGDTPWDGYQWNDKDGRPTHLAEMMRPELDQAIRELWDHTQRFAKVARILSRDAKLILSGEHVQDESGKPSIEPEPRSRAPRP